VIIIIGAESQVLPALMCPYVQAELLASWIGAHGLSSRERDSPRHRMRLVFQVSLHRLSLCMRNISHIFI